jgi:hypothetical protein
MRKAKDCAPFRILCARCRVEAGFAIGSETRPAATARQRGENPKQIPKNGKSEMREMKAEKFLLKPRAIWAIAVQRNLGKIATRHKKKSDYGVLIAESSGVRPR